MCFLECRRVACVELELVRSWAYKLEYMCFKTYITQYKLKYNIIKSLDSGAFGTIYEIQADDNKRYALKELK